MTTKQPASNSRMIHESAYVDEGAVLGENVQVWHFSHIMSGAKIGADCKLGQNVFIDKDVVIGRGVKVQNNVSVYRCVTIEDDVFVGPSAVFTNVLKPRSEFPKKIEEYSHTLVKKGATLGANCTIVCGSKVGCYAFVAAGSVVTREVPDFAMVLGVPARQVGWMCRCGEKLKTDNAQSGQCSFCSRSFKIEKTGCHVSESKVE